MAKNLTTANGFRVAPGEPELLPVALTSEGGSLLKALYATIDCRFVDVIRLTDDIDLWVDDEALLTGEPQPNEGLTMMLLAFGRPYQPIFGTGVFLSSDREGSTVSLNAHQRKTVLTAFEKAVAL